MSDKPRKLRPNEGKPVEESEEDILLRSLRAHGQVAESADPDTPLKPGQTHLYVKKPGEKTGYLIEKRKSFFSR